MDDDFDDLLGTPAPAQVSDDHDDWLDDTDEASDDLYATAGKEFYKTLTATHVDRALKGCPPLWYAKLLGIGRTTVQRKLDHLTPRVIRNGTKLYNPREALPHLVQPADLKKHLMQMSPKDMPERLRKEFWTARKTELDVRQKSGDLWHTSDVHRVTGDLMRLLKDTVVLWTDTIDERTGLSAEHIGILDELCRKLLSDYADAVSQYIADNRTSSQIAELDEEGDDVP